MKVNASKSKKHTLFFIMILTFAFFFSMEHMKCTNKCLNRQQIVPFWTAFMGDGRLLGLLRGRKVPFRLVGGTTKLIDPSLYPFIADEVPILCDMREGQAQGQEAYTSGLRSIVLPGAGGSWFKAKAIGIPSGLSRPFYHDGWICTYHLSEAYIGTGRLIWGFSTVEEAENEISWMAEARELGLPTVKFVGMGFYNRVRVIDVKNRVELFETLNSTPKDALLERFRDSGRAMDAACVFTSQPTDVRVDEILYGFLHPLIHEVMDKRDCKGFLRWMGSSCGCNLRMHHDAGLLHGTVPRGGGFMTNSHTANHLVDESGTYTTDYHMAYRSEDKDLKRVEAFFLASVMNPLPRAEEAAGKAFGQQRPMIFEMPVDATTPFPFGYFEDQMFTPRGPQEEFTEAFLDGTVYGYNRRKTRSVEASRVKKSLLKAAACKKELFRLLGLPEDLERGVEQVAIRLVGRSFSEVELKASLERIEEDLSQK